MGIFDKALKTAKNVGASVGNATINVASSMGTSVQNNSEVGSIKMNINAIKQELDASYIQIGKKYVDYVIESGDMPGIDVSDLLKMMDPKITKLKELEEELIRVEKEIKQQNVIREKMRAEEELQAEKTKLDRALAMDIISQDEYNYKLAKASKRVENFEEIRRVEQQFEMNLITKEEMNAKIEELTK